VPGGKKVIVGIGEILWDMLPAGKRLGGAPANFVYHVREIGGGAVVPWMVSCVGKDAPGREILSRWDRLSLGARHLAVDPGHPTGTVTVSVDAQGGPVYRIETGVAWDFLPESPQLDQLAAAADAVCYGTLAQRSAQSRRCIQNFLRHTRPETLRIFDINLRPPFFTREVAEESLTLADVLKVNSEELGILADFFSLSGGEEAVAEGLLQRWRLRLVALTKGKQGSRLFAPGACSAHPGYAVSVADTVGAGDAFCAAVVVGMLGGFALERINVCANRAASFVSTQTGAMPEMPVEIKNLFL
jgi:fructokinase